jgi:predicted dehydrogenase
MKQTYRVAIIGTGSASGSHINALRHVGERVEIAAAMDVDEARVKAFCERHHIPRWYTNAAELLEATQPDLVHIITPPGTHRDLAIASLEAGAWVYCEKPLCVSLAEFDQITEAEARTGRYVTVFQWRFGSAARHVKCLIDSGELGRPLVGVCQTLWYRADAYYQLPWRGRYATETGGVSSVMGIHLMDLYLWLMNDWREIQAIAATLDRIIEVENVAMALVKFDSGALGSITNSAVSPRQETYLRLDFQRATIDVTALYRASNEHWRFSIPDGSPDQEALTRWRTIEQNISGSHDVQVAELIESMDRGERPLVSGPEARRIIEFLASLYKSAFTGQGVQRGSITPEDPFYHSMNGSLQTIEGA